MAREVDATSPPPPTGFSNFSREWEELSSQTKFLAVGSSLGQQSMKKVFKSDLPLKLALKLDKGRVLGGGNHPHGLFLPIFLTMKMTFNFDKLWYGVRRYKGKFVEINS